MNIDMHSILLDEHNVPKLSKFYYYVSILEGETDVEAHYVNRILSYSTPELKATSKVTKKTDVYKLVGLTEKILIKYPD